MAEPKQDDETAPQSDTKLLRRAWSHSAQQVIDKLRNGDAVTATDVNSLQQGLENIERREDFEEARELTRGPRTKA